MNYCVKCGAPLTPEAQFCSKCGTPAPVEAPVTPPPVVPPPVAQVAQPPVAQPTPARTPVIPPTTTAIPPATSAKRSTWWIVPLVIIGLVLVAWLLLAGLPFGGEKRVVTTATTETIAEGSTTAPTAPTGTIVEVGQDDDPDFATETAAPPPLATATQTVPPVTQTQPVIVEQPPVTATQPPRVVTRPPATQPPVTRPPVTRPPVVQPRPTPPPVQQPAPRPVQQPAPREEITEAEASSVLRGQLAGSNPYDGVSLSCMQIRSLGYRNVGYTFAVWDSCIEGGGSRMLGRWRVDSKTREVFRQRDDGRYLRP